MRRRLAIFALAVTLLCQPAFAAARAHGPDRDPGVAVPGVMTPIALGLPLPVPTVVPPRPQRANAVAANFLVHYDGGFTPEARAAFQAAVDIWAAQITSTVPIIIDASFAPLGTTTLGSAGPQEFRRDFAGTPRPGILYPIALVNKLAGTDLDPDRADILAQLSSDRGDWYFGGGATPAGQVNFTSVVLHELGHGLGFGGSAAYATGSGAWGSPTGHPYVYDGFVYNGADQQLTTAFPNHSAALGAQYTSGALVFNGPTARAANGGDPPRLYAPNPWVEDASIAHLDEATYGPGHPDSLMTPTIAPGEAIYDPGAITRAIFTDMGWTTTVPEPSASPTPGQAFADVPTDYWAHTAIETFAQRRITTGCGTDAQLRRVFCPERGVSRAEMATFITRVLEQANTRPPATPTFADVPTDHWAYQQIEAYARLGITTGCGTDEGGRPIFCPERGVTRAEMAVFIDRAKHQDALQTVTPTFADVPADYWAYGWIERFFSLGVTTGCGEDANGNKVYCPDRGVTRAEMAVFIIRAYPQAPR